MDNKLNSTTSPWQVSSLRLTVFPSPSANVESKPDKWWNEIIGDTPESISQSPKTGGVRAEGSTDYGKFVIEFQPQRIDLVLKVVDDSNLPLDANQVVENFDQALLSFSQLANNWFKLKVCPTFLRIAFGAVLYQIIDGKEDGYRLLAKYLPNVEIDPIGSSDFIYRINRPRISQTITNLSINRLSTWSVLVLSQILMMLNGAKNQTIPQTETFRVLAELDINTSEEHIGEFSIEQAVEVFGESIELAEEISKKGDIK
ncbi:MAG: hypothetical protein WA821_06930 [Anaerolineales bacterium]